MGGNTRWQLHISLATGDLFTQNHPCLFYLQKVVDATHIYHLPYTITHRTHKQGRNCKKNMYFLG